MGRQPCCDHAREGLKKGPWSAEEDHKLLAFISAHGLACWRQVPKLAGLKRCGKSCRLRWINYLRPDLKRGVLSPHEESLVIHLHASYGNKWSRIAAQLPGRTDNEIKNCWNTRIKKKLQNMGIDPVTHKPLFDMTLSPAPGVNDPSSLGHLHRAYHQNMMAIQRLREGLLDTSPHNVISPQINTSLSHTPPTTNHEEEQSVDHSADSVSHNRSMDSNAQASAHEFASEEMLQGDPYMMFTCSHSGKEGLDHAPCMLSACQATIGEAVSNFSHAPEDAPYMHNPAHMLHNAAHMHNPPHMLQNVPDIPPHMPHISQHRAWDSVEPTQHIVQANQPQLSQASLVTSKIEDEGMPSSSLTINESNDGCNEGIEDDVSAVNDENEHMMALTYARNALPYGLSPSMIKYLQDGVLPQPSQLHELKLEGATSASVSSQGQWFNTMSDMLYLENGGAELAPHSGTSPVLYETNHLLGQHHNVTAACNLISNMGQWASMDYLWGDPMSLTN